MAERKVLNKYYPPDFDPSKLRRFEKKTVRRMCNVRMMLPMSVRCYTCRNYMYIGTKFNMKVETVKDEDYLGIKVYRFYFKCTQCYSEITFKTDPKNHDYVSEWGASRNHEMWKDMLMAEEEYKDKRQNEMKEDAMKSLEHRTYDSKREMDILDALDQVKTLNRRQALVNFDELIEKAIKNDGIEDLRATEEREKEEAKEKFKQVREKRIEDYIVNIDETQQEQQEQESITTTDNNLIQQDNNLMLGRKSERNNDINFNINNIQPAYNKINKDIYSSDSDGEKEKEREDIKLVNTFSSSMKPKLKITTISKTKINPNNFPANKLVNKNKTQINSKPSALSMINNYNSEEEK